MKARLIVIATVILTLSIISVPEASKLPVRSATPTGCVSRGVDVIIDATREWGVVPFTSTFTVRITGGDDSIEAVYWSFGADAPLEDLGARSTHTFSEPVDYLITVEVVTAEHGVITKRFTVTGHNAVMSLTFDDGHKTLLTNAMPLLATYCVTATAYIVPAWTQIDPDAYMTWEDIADLQDAGWDIGSHSMTHPKLTEADPFDLDWEIRQSQVVLQNRGFPAKSFSLPHEAYNETVMNIVKQYYQSCKTDRGINPGINDTDPYMIQSQTSLSWRPFSYYQAHIDSVLVTGGWYILNNHVLREDCQGGNWCVTAAQLSQVIEYAQANRVKIANIQEVMDSRNAGISLGEDGLDASNSTHPDDEREPALEVLSAPQYLSHSPVEIRYYVEVPGQVGVSVFDVMGRRVSSLLERNHGAGEHAAYWDGRNASGSIAASGHYFVVFALNGEIHATARITVVR
jgi:peptidoglycan/xylan/chitin deacetylase (PgdA/CDA1 family)